MNITELREGARVTGPEGENLGKIERYVVDPSTRDVTHVVIQKGIVFPEERVVPVEALHPGAEEGRLTLDPEVDTDHLPVFEERHYVDLTADTSGTPVEPQVPVSAWAYPIAPVGHYPVYPSLAMPPLAVESTRNVPDGSIVVEERARVVTADGDDVGRVKEVATDASGRLAYIVADPGLLASERLIPEHWIDSVDETTIRLALDAEAIRRLDR